MEEHEPNIHRWKDSYLKSRSTASLIERIRTAHAVFEKHEKIARIALVEAVRALIVLRDKLARRQRTLRGIASLVGLGKSHVDRMLSIGEALRDGLLEEKDVSSYRAVAKLITVRQMEAIQREKDAELAAVEAALKQAKKGVTPASLQDTPVLFQSLVAKVESEGKLTGPAAIEEAHARFEDALAAERKARAEAVRRARLEDAIARLSEAVTEALKAGLAPDSIRGIVEKSLAMEGAKHVGTAQGDAGASGKAQASNHG